MPLLPTLATVNCRALPSLPPAPPSDAKSFMERCCCCCDRSRSMSVLFLTFRSEFCGFRPPRFSGDTLSTLTALAVALAFAAPALCVWGLRSVGSGFTFVLRVAAPLAPAEA